MTSRTVISSELFIFHNISCNIAKECKIFSIWCTLSLFNFQIQTFRTSHVEYNIITFTLYTIIHNYTGISIIKEKFKRKLTEPMI